jgi:hypothetical protein
MPGNLVLISAGSEECGGDIQETVRLLASESSQLTVDVLSLGQTEKQNAPLEELTRLTEGRLFAVRNDEDAKTTFEVIVQRLFSRSNLSVSAHDLWKDEEFTETPLSWEVYGVEGEQSLVGTFTGPALRLSVTPGLYWVVAQGPKHRYGLQVHVPKKKPAAKRLSLALGHMELIPRGIADADQWSYRILSAMPGQSSGKALVSKVNVTGKQEVTLPHGHYRVTFQQDGSSKPFTKALHAESERRHRYDLSFNR